MQGGTYSLMWDPHFVVFEMYLWEMVVFEVYLWEMVVLRVSICECHFSNDVIVFS